MTHINNNCYDMEQEHYARTTLSTQVLPRISSANAGGAVYIHKKIVGLNHEYRTYRKAGIPSGSCVG